MEGHGEGDTSTNAHVVAALGRAADGALLSGGWDKTARVWRGEAPAPEAVLRGHDVAVNAVAGLPDGAVATGSGDQTIGVWRGGACVRRMNARAPVRALCAVGGGRLASGANDGWVRVWDAATGEQLGEHKVRARLCPRGSIGTAVHHRSPPPCGPDTGQWNRDSPGAALAQPPEGKGKGVWGGEGRPGRGGGGGARGGERPRGTAACGGRGFKG